MATQADANRMNALLAKDPTYQSLVQQLSQAQAKRGARGGADAIGRSLALVKDRMRALGVDPEEYSVGDNGVVDNQGFWGKHGGQIAGIGVGGAVAAPLLIGALAGGGGAAAAGTGATAAGTGAGAGTAAGAGATAAGAGGAATAAGAGTAAAAGTGMSAGMGLGVGLAGLGLDAITTFYGMNQQGKALRMQAENNKAQIDAQLEAARLGAQTQKDMQAGNLEFERARLASQEKQAAEDRALAREQFQLNAQLAREQLGAAASRLAEKNARLAPFLQALATGLMGSGAKAPSGGGGNGAPPQVPGAPGAPPADPMAAGAAGPVPPNANAAGGRTLAMLNADGLAMQPGARTLADLTQGA